jgi:hypothetical protein
VIGVYGLAALLFSALQIAPAVAATSVTFQPSTADSYLDAANTTTNNGTATELRVRSLTASRRRAVVQFAVSTIPTDAAVKTATLSLWITTVFGSSRTVGAHLITGSVLWTQGGVTWNSRNGTNNWATAGGDFNATATAAQTTGTGTGQKDWVITADVQAWVNGSAVNNGTLMKDTSEGSTDVFGRFASNNNGTTGNRPRLVVSYLLKARDLTATAGNAQVILNWVLPGGSPDYNGTLIIRQANNAPTSIPADGTNYAAGAPLPDGSVVVVNDTSLATTVTDTGLTNGTTYYYQAFTRDSSVKYSLASATVSSTPTTTVSPSPTWSYATSAASMAPPGLDPWSNIVVTGSNDNKFHGMNDSDGTRAFNPFTTGGPIQARPAILPAAYRTPSTSVNIAYVTSQDGFTYAIDTSTGLQVWQSALLGTTLQGGANVWLQAFNTLSICGVTTADVVFVGTSNTGNTTNNKVYALNGSGGNVASSNTGAPNCTNGTVAPGGILWTFSPAAQISVDMDIVSSTPYVDFGTNAVWVTSRAAGGTLQPSVWKLNAATGALMSSGTNTWNFNDIDSTPSPSAGGSFVYVGTNAGTLKAIRVSDGTVFTHTPGSGTGAIKGLPWPLWYNAVGPEPGETIIFTRDTTVHSVNFDGATFTSNWAKTLTGTPTLSAPVDDGANHLYIGGSDGKVHQLDADTGNNEQMVPTTAISGTMGDPTFNVDLNRIHVGGSDGHIYTFATPF